MLFVRFLVVGIHTGRDIGRQGLRGQENVPHGRFGLMSAGDVLEAVADKAGGSAGGAFRADFLLVPDHEGHVFGSAVTGLAQRHESGVDADAVVLAVTAHERAVKAHIASSAGRNHLDFGGDEVFLAHAVFLLEKLEDGLFDRSLGLVLRVFGLVFRAVAQNDVEFLTLEGVLNGFRDLIVGEMRQQIGDGEEGIAGLLAYAYGHG